LRALALVGLVLLAIVFALAGHSVPAIGALHPIDAFAVVALSAYLAHDARRTRNADSAPT
jgi:hypothetical protein